MQKIAVPVLPHPLHPHLLRRADPGRPRDHRPDAGNAIIEDAIMAVRKGFESGLTIASRSRTPVSPPMVVQMIGVGEQTAPSTRCSARSRLLRGGGRPGGGNL